MSQQQPTIQQGSAMALVLTIAGLLFVFGFIAQEMVKGKTLAFDREVMLAFAARLIPASRLGQRGCRKRRGT